MRKFKKNRDNDIEAIKKKVIKYFNEENYKKLINTYLNKFDALDFLIDLVTIDTSFISLKILIED